VSLLGLDIPQLRERLPELQPYRAKQIYEAVYRQHKLGWAEITTLPGPLRETLESSLPFGLPEVEKEYHSADGTIRYLLKLSDARTVESVLMPEEDRDTICISTQVGCPVDCKFCLTALIGLERNMTAGEIVGQVLLLAARHGLDPNKRRVNIVMMGQGEPLLNLPNVLQATKLIVEGMGIAERRITLSTSGIVPKIAELAASNIRPKLAISLNASTEEQRCQLMPITRKYSLEALLDACHAYPLRSWEFLMFEYVLLAGVNDTDADARRVVQLLAGLQAKVNLIALNPGPGIPFQTPSPERVQSFQNIVMKSRHCFLRKPRGLDIYAACGQLQRMNSESLVEISL